MSMRSRLPAPIALALLAIAFVALVFFSGLLLRGARLDLTANRLFTLSDGTEHILAKNREPIHLQLFLSDHAMRDQPALRAYAQRVRELIEEMADKSHGSVTLETIDPQPFSEAEDKASGYGLQALPIGPGGTPLYFGLVGTNSHHVQTVEPFFDPSKEVFLEYDIAKLITSLSSQHKPAEFRPSHGPCQRRLGDRHRACATVRAASPATKSDVDRQRCRSADTDPSEGPVRRHVLRDRPVRAARRAPAGVRRSLRRGRCWFAEPAADRAWRRSEPERVVLP